MLASSGSHMAQILIVCDNDSDTERLKIVFRKAGLATESANSITAGCKLAQSGRFQVVFSAPLLGDGSWKRLTNIAKQHDSTFAIILLARTFNLNEWAEALEVGAFEVLDVLCDLPKAAEAAKRALGATFLKHVRLSQERVV
jgi:DNA-binding NtrC family response regulator